MIPLSFLEDFDDPPPTSAGPSPAYQAGFAAGQAAALAQAEASQTRLAQDTAQALADLSFSLAGAEQALMAQIAPLLRLLAQKIVPQILHDTLGVALCEELLQAADSDLRRPLRLHLPPADCAATGAIVTAIAGARVTLYPDPALLRGQAILTAPDGETAFDHARLARDLADAIEAICAEPPRRYAHG